MSFGIGLGAFMDGFERGQGLRQKFDENKRINANRDAVQKIGADTQAQFDKGVAAGQLDPNSFDQFWMDYALPKMRMELLKQGDIKGAHALMEWGQSESALQGGRLFSSALVKAQTGDAAGALNDAISAGKVQGYIKHGYELVGQDEIKDSDGNTIGYRLKVKDQDGKEFDQDIAVGDIPRAVATFANPQAAWQSQVAGREEERKRKTDLEDYEKKEQIKSRYAKGPDHEKAYMKAREDRMANDLDFGDLSPEEQDRVIRADLQAAGEYSASRGGQSGSGNGGEESSAAPETAAPAKVIVDQGTGEKISAAPGLGGNVSPAPSADAAPGLGASPAPQRATPAKAAPNPSPAPKPTSQADVIAEAADYITKGGDPQAIAQRLMNFGVPKAQWPDELQKRLAQPSNAVGLAAP